MAELCLSRTSNSQFSTLIYSDFALFCSFIFSHPLYLSYFIFFSPYLLRLLSFLSPLFITTSLLLLSLIYDKGWPKLSEPGSSFLLSTFHGMIDKLHPKFGHEFHDLEEFEAYKIVFLVDDTFEVSEPKTEENCLKASFDQILVPKLEISDLPLMEEKESEEFFEETMDSSRVDDEVVGVRGTKFGKVVEDEEEKTRTTSGSEATDKTDVTPHDRLYHKEEYTQKVTSHAEAFNKNVEGNIDNGASKYEDLGANLGSYGSMRKEKEWKRTLACKLFEERHNVVEGDEGMDSLWETYELDLSKSKRKDDFKKKKKKKAATTTKSTEINYYGDEEEDDDDELEMSNGQLCCLQALKLSAGKMNLGMGRPNLVKISKALKGIGWLHQVKKHGKKNKF